MANGVLCGQTAKPRVQQERKCGGKVSGAVPGHGFGGDRGALKPPQMFGGKGGFF